MIEYKLEIFQEDDKEALKNLHDELVALAKKYNYHPFQLMLSVSRIEEDDNNPLVCP